MSELTFPEALGVGSSQTTTEFIISKAGLSTLLASKGYTYTPSDNDSVDKLFIVLALVGLATMNPEERAKDPVARNIEFRYDPAVNFDSPTIDGQSYNRFVIEQAIYKPITIPKINPADFS
jgi:hypothetical protein